MKAMRSLVIRRGLLLALAAVAASVIPAYSDHRDRDGHDHDRAREARMEGRARPLAEILDRLRAKLDGKIVGVEFENDSKRPTYELKVVTPAGQLREIEVDAMTAEILKIEDDD